MTPEEYYGNAFPLLKQGEAYLKSLIETYPNACAEDELQSILYVKTRIKSPESMMGKLKKRGLMEDAHTAFKVLMMQSASGSYAPSWRRCTRLQGGLKREKIFRS